MCCARACVGEREKNVLERKIAITLWMLVTTLWKYPFGFFLDDFLSYDFFKSEFRL